MYVLMIDSVIGAHEQVVVYCDAWEVIGETIVCWDKQEQNTPSYVYRLVEGDSLECFVRDSIDNCDITVDVLH